jgi:hypothetical protein
MQNVNQSQQRNELLASLKLLSNETRVIATPWSRVVRGLGLGQHTCEYDESVSLWIQEAFDYLKEKTNFSNGYVNASSLLCDLILLLAAPKSTLSEGYIMTYIKNILFVIQDEPNPYRRIMQMTILVDVAAKLHIEDLLLRQVDIISLLFQSLDKIKPNQIKDENAGRHGDYEKLSAYTSVLLSVGLLHRHEQLVTDEHNYILDALNTLEKIPSPFFRGRGGAMLFSVIALLGYQGFISSTGRDYLRETLSYMDRADELNLHPAFPQPMSMAFVKVYPLLTMLNAIALTGNKDYLFWQKDRIAEVKELISTITPVERTHMGLYYIIALYNLGLAQENYIEIVELIEELVQQTATITPSQNYFLHGISYAYIMETAMLTGRRDLIDSAITERAADAFFHMNCTAEDEVNRPYPLSYSLTMLGEMGCADKLLCPTALYEGKSALQWVIDNCAPVKDENDGRLYMLNNALVNYALRMRGSSFEAPAIYRHARFAMSER